MHNRNNFIYRNETFTCEYCETENTRPERGIRNHCFNCLASKHVDEELPGDRLSECHGKMVARRIKSDPKREWVLQHNCMKCHHKSNNMTQSDDNSELITKLIHDTNLQNLDR